MRSNISKLEIYFCVYKREIKINDNAVEFAKLIINDSYIGLNLFKSIMFAFRRRNFIKESKYKNRK